MWWKGFNKAHLKASTLAELLVVMVVTSILLLSVTDGLTLFGRYTRLITEKVTRNGEVWEGYCHLESLVASSDSLALMPSGRIEVYQAGVAAELSVGDSVLSFSREGKKDTLLCSVAGIDVSASASGNDSLLVFIAIGQRRLRIAFAPHPKPRAVTPELYDLEEKYRYD